MRALLDRVVGWLAVAGVVAAAAFLTLRMMQRNAAARAAGARARQSDSIEEAARHSARAMADAEEANAVAARLDAQKEALRRRGFPWAAEVIERLNRHAQ